MQYWNVSNWYTFLAQKVSKIYSRTLLIEVYARIIRNEKVSADEDELAKFKEEFEKLVLEEVYSQDHFYIC